VRKILNVLLLVAFVLLLAPGAYALEIPLAAAQTTSSTAKYLPFMELKDRKPEDLADAILDETNRLREAGKPPVPYLAVTVVADKLGITHSEAGRRLDQGEYTTHDAYEKEVLVAGYNPAALPQKLDLKWFTRNGRKNEYLVCLKEGDTVACISTNCVNPGGFTDANDYGFKAAAVAVDPCDGVESTPASKSLTYGMGIAVESDAPTVDCFVVGGSKQ
jgi:hypothetical protein